MNKKLDMIQEDIASIRSNLKRLVDRPPPLNVISDWRRKYLLEISEKRCMLRQRCAERDQNKEDFKKDAVFNKSYLVNVAFKEFMENDKEDKNDLKSIAVEKMKKYVLEKPVENKITSQSCSCLYLRLH